jgi:hypothetical protein
MTTPAGYRIGLSGNVTVRVWPAAKRNPESATALETTSIGWHQRQREPLRGGRVLDIKALRKPGFR